MERCKLPEIDNWVLKKEKMTENVMCIDCVKDKTCKRTNGIIGCGIGVRKIFKPNAITDTSPKAIGEELRVILDWIKEQHEYKDVLVVDRLSIFHYVAPIEYADLIYRYMNHLKTK